MNLNSIRTRIIFWTSLSLLMMGCAIIGLAAISVRNTSIESAKDHQKFLAHDRADHVGILLSREMDKLQTLALILEKTKDPLDPLILDRDQVDTLLESLLKQNKNIIGVYTSWLPNKFDGKDSHYENEPGHGEKGRFAPYWYRNRYGIIDVMPLTDFEKTGSDKYRPFHDQIQHTQVTEPRIHDIEGEDFLAVSLILPILIKDKFLGIIGMDMRLKGLQALTDESGIDKKEGWITIFSPGGKILGATGRQDMAGENAIKLIHNFRQYKTQLDKDEAFLTQCQDHIAFFAPVKIMNFHPWWVSVTIPRNVITAKASALTKQLILVGTVCIILSILTVWFLAGRITIPLITLIKHIHLIGRGKYDLVFEDVETSDEIGELAQAFNKMAVKIKTKEKERDDAEKTLRLYEQIVSSITDMMSFIDVNYRYKAVNDAYFDFFPGRSRENTIGHTPADLVGQDNFLKKIKPHLDQCLKGEIVTYQANLEFSGKGRLDLSINYYPVIKEGTVLGIIQISRDITLLLKSQKDLQESEARARLILDTMPSGLYTVDLNKKITYWNKHAEKITGFAHEAVIGNTCFEIFGENECKKPCCLFENKVKKPIHGRECPINTKHGDMLISKNMDLLKDANGNIVGGLESFVDITRSRRLEAQLLQSQKMEAIGTLAGGIAHDFNNILFPLLGYSEMLKDDLPPDSPLHGHVDEILTAALRAKDLVKQILAFSRQGDQHLRPIKLQPIVKEALKLIRSSIPTTIDIQQDMDTDCNAVVADPTQIHQIIMNLATNAYHAMEDSGGRLSVGLKQIRLESNPSFFPELAPGEYARLRVSDTGIGIKKNIMDKIFDPYFTTKETGKGTGLGLSVVLGIVKGCNGDIAIYSEPGKGTEIKVYLPVITPMAEDEPIGRDAPIQGGTEKILLVDDEEAIIIMERQMLERLGYKITISTGSLEALATFKADPYAFDLIITDMTMPNMTGVQLAESIKKIRPDIPVILCTGFSYHIDDEKSKALGIQEFVMKPVVMREMAKSIRNVLDNLEKEK